MSEIRTPPRKLVDLNPKWVRTTSGEIYGITYDCPCGLPTFEPVTDENGQYTTGSDGKLVGVVPWVSCCKNGGTQVVPTKSHFAGHDLVSCADSIARGWSLTGDSFENVTLSPSIHAVGHWHGFLQNGVLVSC